LARTQGLLDSVKLDSYNIPAYEPCAEEVREIVDAEGSFEIVGGHAATMRCGVVL
jgi:hypothetical protein